VLLSAIGVPLALLGGLVAAVGLERALTVWNDQMALLPWGLSRILGITVYLGIPAYLPTAAALFGVALIALAALLSLRRRPRHLFGSPPASLPAGRSSPASSVPSPSARSRFFGATAALPAGSDRSSPPVDS
jgi:TRAP-type C4-dicarboxylate transport system permease small subunit